MSIPHEAIMTALPGARRSRIEERVRELLAEENNRVGPSIEHAVEQYPWKQTTSIHVLSEDDNNDQANK